MLIEPDLGVRDDSGYEAIALVTHATAKNAAGVKIDRSLEELFEAKTRAPKPNCLLMINLIWHSPFGWTKGHISRLDNAFDLNWVAFRDSHAYASHLQGMVSLAKTIATLSIDDSLAAVEGSGLATAFIPEIKKKIAAFSRPLRLHQSLWSCERSRLATLPTPIGTISNTVKLDLTALSMLPPNSLGGFLTASRMPYAPVYDPVLASGGLVRVNSIKGSFVTMPAPLAARVGALCASAGLDPVEWSLSSARVAEGFSAFFVAFESPAIAEERVRRVRSAATSSGFNNLLDDAWDATDPLFTGTCWPLEFAVALVQETSESGYGLLTLQREALGDLNPSFGWDPLWRYVSGDRTRLSGSDIAQVCHKISGRLSGISTRSSDGKLAAIVQARISKRLRRKKKANPLLWFVRAVIDASTMTATGFPSIGMQHQCPFSQLAGLRSISGRSAWHFRIVDKHVPGSHRLLHVLSSYSSTHKHKEYALKGRLVHYGTRKASVVLSQAVTQVAVLLDGKWSSSQTELLRNAGVSVFAIDDIGSWVAWGST